MARRRSFGSVFLGFIRGLISFILFLVLVVSVGANLVFRNKDSAPRIDFLDYHMTFFINRSTDAKNIAENSLCFIDHTDKPKEATYVLCSTGEEGKRILCLESITQNDNGSLSYNLRSDLMASLDTVYSVPASKIYGTVYNKDDLMGEILAYSTEFRGIIALMVLPALLLIILSIATIRAKKLRYDDDLLEAELFIEEKRKQKRNEEKRAEEHRKLMAEKAAAEAESAMAARARVEAAVREAEAAQNAVPEAPVSDPDPAPFSFEEYKKKADAEFNEAVQKQAPLPAAEPVINPAPAPAPVPAAPAPVPAETPAPAPVKEEPHAPAAETVNKYEFTEFTAEPEEKKAPETVKAPEKEEKNEDVPAFQEVPLSVRPSYRYEQMIQDLTSAAEVRHTTEPEAAPAPAPAGKPAPAKAPAKKKPSKPAKKLNADSIDDLIRILEEEKKKLD
ncbi:hypothetical protein [Ruminococcus sp. HUN007]|uniref:hypothetical protein n=1 Tax=Ruminococcus sp. HUN007 TaxID=1514668 RepID=UPI0005D1D0EA|nr:hypothetical protein [Ruminococcus sp. HUN007]